jgi:hypothetical protein
MSKAAFTLRRLHAVNAIIGLVVSLALSSCEQKSETTAPAPKEATPSPTAMPAPTAVPVPSAVEPERTTPPPEDIPLPEQPPPPPEIQPEFHEETTPPPRQGGKKKAKPGHKSEAAAEPSATPTPVKKDGHPATGDSVSPGIPEFTLPPPLVSASQEVPRELLVGGKTQPLLGDAEKALNHAFEQCDYGDKRYYALRDKAGSSRDGFALASRMEHMNADGTANEDRWSREDDPMRTFSINNFVRALFQARPGHYRVIVFVLTNKPLTEDTKVRVSSEQAGLWTKEGAHTLPKEIAEMEYTADYQCTALIYEFKTLAGGKATFVEPSEVSGKTHLQKSGLWAALQQPR